MSAARIGGRYRSASTWHDVLVTRDHSGRWQVLDTAGSEIVIVETLTGHDDRLDQALALARDYADQQQEYRDGRCESDPLPRPIAIDDTPGTAERGTRAQVPDRSPGTPLHDNEEDHGA
jgi:hypothetical protein